MQPMLHWLQQPVKRVLSFKTQGDADEFNRAENVLLRCSKQNALLTISPFVQKDTWVALFKGEMINNDLLFKWQSVVNMWGVSEDGLKLFQ